MLILVINAGSSSLKYQLIDMNGEICIAKGLCERIGVDGKIEAKNMRTGEVFEEETAMPNHTVAFQSVKKALISGNAKVIDDLAEIKAVGHRIVQGGALFNKSVVINDAVIDGIESLCDLAPLHNPAHIQGIRACIEVFGKEVPEVAVFDNAFHSTMPPEAYMFPIPYEYYEKYKIRRYGFHGTSHRYVSARCAKLMGQDSKGLKIITCHLGNGASITAVKNGEVVDTSMGLTPLDGFIMGTRTGGIDPSAVTYLQAKEGWTPEQTDTVLNKKSGVLGISGISNDDRDVKAAAEQGNQRAKLARDIQWYQIRKFIGSYTAAMQGVDAIVFTGGIGENTFDLRADVCEKLAFLGIELNAQVNEKTIRGAEAEITAPASKIKVFVIPTNEELMIARDTQELTK